MTGGAPVCGDTLLNLPSFPSVIVARGVESFVLALKRRARPIRAAWLASHWLGRAVALAGPAAPGVLSLGSGRPACCSAILTVALAGSAPSPSWLGEDLFRLDDLADLGSAGINLARFGLVDQFAGSGGLDLA
jgi:hypothetical protein